MLDKIKLYGKTYIVCGSNKVSLYNKLIDENKNNFIYEDIFKYEIITDFYMLNKIKKCIELDKNNGLNSNEYYLDFIRSLPWTNDLDKILDNYTNCSELMENHFRKKPDRPNITFGNIPIKYNKYYYQYILQTNEQCIECKKDEINGCTIYNKIYNFLNIKMKIKSI